MKKSKKHRGTPKAELKGSARIAGLYHQAAVVSAKMQGPLVSDNQFNILMAKHAKLVQRIHNAQLHRAGLQ
jgi:hypothetical protein